MNYVILNGVKSNTIKGLLIQSLPSISKPLIRTEVEEIDGRDGDIVTKLGYSAYDKVMTIGLYGNYNVDDVIQYFNSEGTVTFSNEPDKYYNYTIVEQIDFERLIRYKTAEVTFHVQPFKYSAVSSDYKFSNDYLMMNDFTSTKNGVTVSITDGKISVMGTAVSVTEFYVPVSSQISKGNYKLTATVKGTTGNVCSIRLIKDTPTDADSFGGNYLPLLSNADNVISANITEDKTYGYLWFYINPNSSMNFTIDIALTNTAFNNVSIRNLGNVISRPRITLYGSGTVYLSINGIQLFTVQFDGYITLDGTQMNAYQGDRLMNRYVLGDYDNLVFNVGTNTVSWTGDVSEIEVENFTRWI